MNGRLFDITMRATSASMQGGGQISLLCPNCSSTLLIHQPEEESAYRLLGSCDCEECGVWYSLIPAPDRSQIYLIRLPSMTELREAMVRQGIE